MAVRSSLKLTFQGFYIDVAGSGGFKTTPVAAKTHAHLIATDQSHELTRDLGLNRFGTGHLVVEGGVSANH